MLNARAQRNPICLCQKNLGRMESQNHKITNVTSKKTDELVPYYIIKEILITYYYNNI